MHNFQQENALEHLCNLYQFGGNSDILKKTDREKDRYHKLYSTIAVTLLVLFLIFFLHISLKRG